MKIAILLVTFGTSVREARINTIEKLKSEIEKEKEFSNVSVKLAFTSQKIIKKIYEKEQIKFHNLQEALNEISKEDYDTLFVLPTFLEKGNQYEEMIKIISSFIGYEPKNENIPNVKVEKFVYESNNDNNIMKLVITSSLISDTIECSQVLNILMDYIYSEIGKNCSQLPQGSKVVLATHNQEISNMINEVSENEYAGEIFAISIEDKNQLNKLANTNIETAYLIPFMFTAGYHAKKDIFGKDASSCINILTDLGVETIPVKISLGEIGKIRKMYINKLKEGFKCL